MYNVYVMDVYTYQIIKCLYTLMAKNITHNNNIKHCTYTCFNTFSARTFFTNKNKNYLNKMYCYK